MFTISHTRKLAVQQLPASSQSSVLSRRPCVRTSASAPGKSQDKTPSNVSSLSELLTFEVREAKDMQARACMGIFGNVLHALHCLHATQPTAQRGMHKQSLLLMPPSQSELPAAKAPAPPAPRVLPPSQDDLSQDEDPAVRAQAILERAVRV